MNSRVLRPKRSTKSTAIQINPILQKGEIFFEKPDSGIPGDSGKIKMGDGVADYNSLPYFINPVNLSTVDTNIEFKNINTGFRGLIGKLVDSINNWRIGGSYKNNSACLEIASISPDYNMPIYVSQYSNTNEMKTLKLLDESGNTHIPGNLSIDGNILEKGILNSTNKADYAEAFNYEGKFPEVGYIVELTENKKVKLADKHSQNVIGVSSNGYWLLAGSSIENVMNRECVAVGLIGQLPIKVIGKVAVGDRIISNGNGVGIVDNSASIFEVVGKAMESNNDENLKDVYCVVK